jgi:hypothetical protein
LSLVHAGSSINHEQLKEIAYNADLDGHGAIDRTETTGVAQDIREYPLREQGISEEGWHVERNLLFNPSPSGIYFGDRALHQRHDLDRNTSRYDFARFKSSCVEKIFDQPR